MEDITRRDFFGAMGAMAAAGTAGAALSEFLAAKQAKAAEDLPEGDPADPIYRAGLTPEQMEILNPVVGDGCREALRAGIPGVKGSANPNFQGPANPICTRAEAIAWLENQPMTDEDWVQPDGKVIPAVYVNLRNRWNRVGLGVGNTDPTVNGQFDWLMYNYSEKEAEWYCKMPFPGVFNADEFSMLSGYPAFECREMCETLCMKGILVRIERAGVPHYKCTALPFGHIQKWDDPDYLHGWEQMYTAQAGLDAVDSGTQTYTKVPCDINIVAESHVVSPYDDWKNIINHQEVFVIDPCSCKTMHAAAMGDFRYETDNDYRMTDGKHDRTNICLAMGELAEYYIWKGVGRQVTRDEAMASVQQSVDDGLVIQHFCTKDTEVICQCRCDNCAILTPQKALAGVGDATWAMSNYYLDLNKDVCIQCGACIERCPMECITFGDDGFPQMGPECVRCGQCAYICPASARTLMPKRIEEQCNETTNVGEDWIEKAIYRRMKGTLVDFDPAQL